MRAASVSTKKGLVSTAMPGSSWPLLKSAFSAKPVMNSTLRSGRADARGVGHLPAVHPARQADIGDEQVDAGT